MTLPSSTPGKKKKIEEVCFDLLIKDENDLHYKTVDFDNGGRTRKMDLDEIKNLSKYGLEDELVKRFFPDNRSPIGFSYEFNFQLCEENKKPVGYMKTFGEWLDKRSYAKLPKFYLGCEKLPPTFEDNPPLSMESNDVHEDLQGYDNFFFNMYF